jgi:hypothetical protein
MDKKEINSPKLTANFLFWVGGVGGVLLVAFLGHYVWKIFLDWQVVVKERRLLDQREAADPSRSLTTIAQKPSIVTR